jgi:hypothetical protein
VKSYVRNERGQIIDTHWAISEIPHTDKPKSEKPISEIPKSGKPTSENPTSVKNRDSPMPQGESGNSPKSGFPTSENPTLRINDQRRNNNLLNNEREKNEEKSRSPTLNENQNLSEQEKPEHPNVETYYRIFGRNGLKPSQKERIAALPDSARWEKTCQWWDDQGYNPKSIGRLFERYEEEASIIPFERRSRKTAMEIQHERNKELLKTDVIF